MATRPKKTPIRKKNLRRHEPGRRDRLVEETLQVIGKRGLAGTTYRSVADAADVPLGSVTYHFASLDELIAAAFMLYVEEQAALFDARLSGVSKKRELADALTDIVWGQFLSDAGKLVIAYELYLGASQNPALRDVTDFWMRRSRGALERIIDPALARVTDALLEGLVLHNILEKEPMNRREIRNAFLRVLGA